MNVYDIGDIVVVVGVFTVNGIRTDPTRVWVRVRKPNDLGVVNYEYLVDSGVEKVSIGEYRLRIPATDPGVWFYRFLGTGAAAAGGEKPFTVSRSQFPPLP